MRKVVLARIDDRLIHGQIMTAWLQTTAATRIIIADDKVASDNFECRLLKATVPADVKVDVLKVDAAAAELLQPEAQGERIILLTKCPETMEALIEKGVTLPEIILGNMGIRQGRERFNRNVSASPEEIATMSRIIEAGSEIYYQMVPKEERVNIRKLVEKGR